MTQTTIVKCPLCNNFFDLLKMDFLSSIVSNIEESYIEEMNKMENEIEKLIIYSQDSEEKLRKSLIAQREISRKTKKLIKSFEGILDLFPNQNEMNVFDSPKIRQAERMIEEINDFFKGKK